MKKLRFCVFLIILASLIIACNDDNTPIDTANMSEEDIYFADYEEPKYKWGYLNEDGRLAIGARYDNTRDFSEGLAATNLKGKWGYIDTNGKTIIPHSFRSAFPFKAGVARVQNFDKLYGFIDIDGKTVLPFQYEEAYDMQDGLIKIKSKKGFNFVDIKGDTLLENDISKVKNFKGGYAIAKDYGKEALLNTDGNLILDYKYDKVYQVNSNFIRVKNDKKYGTVNLEGNTIIELQYDQLTEFQDNVSAAKTNDQWSLITAENELIKTLDASIKNVIPMNQNRWMIHNGSKYAIMDSEGNNLCDFEYDAFNKFHESIAVYELNEAYGYIDVDAKQITGPNFPLCWDFVGDKARAIFDRGVGFLNRHGKPVIPAIFFEVRDFHDGLSRVQIYQ